MNATDLLVDAAGQRHAPASGEVRIVSLVPSLTEMLCALDLTGQLVGRTGFCIHPEPIVRGIAKVGGTKDVDVDKVRALAPTHLVVNIDENEKPVVDALREFVPHVLVTHPVEVADNLGLLRFFGAVFGREAQAAAWCRRLDAELAANRAAGFAPLRALYLIWKRPWMTVGADTFIAKMLQTVGLQAVAPEGGGRYPQVEFERFGADRFDLVLLSTEPYRFDQRHVEALRADPLLGGRPVRLVDGEMTSWYGVRAVEGLSWLRSFRREFDREQTA